MAPISLEPCCKATQLNLVLYVSGAPQPHCCASTRDQVSICKQAILCAGSLRGHLCLQLPSISLGQADKDLADFHCQKWELLFPAQDSLG